MIRRVLWVVSTAVLCGCAGTTTAPPPAPISVTVSMFSGRPDTHFDLSADDAAALRNCLKDGEITTATPPSGLGFRYFIVDGADLTSILIAKSGAWDATNSQPIRICRGGYALLRKAAAAALDPTVANAIPE